LLIHGEHDPIVKRTVGRIDDVLWRAGAWLRLRNDPMATLVPAEFRRDGRYVAGRNGRMFLAHDSNRVLDQHSGRLRMGRGQLAAWTALVARRAARDWLDGVMDLAATVCRPRTPRCAECPVRAMCATRQGGRATSQRAAPAPRFPSTNRWLRGRLLAAVREAPAGAWVDAPDGLGDHDRSAVLAALRGLERDGFLELRDGQARLATHA